MGTEDNRRRERKEEQQDLLASCLETSDPLPETSKAASRGSERVQSGGDSEFCVPSRQKMRNANRRADDHARKLTTELSTSAAVGGSTQVDLHVALFIRSGTPFVDQETHDGVGGCLVTTVTVLPKTEA